MKSLLPSLSVLLASSVVSAQTSTVPAPPKPALGKTEVAPGVATPAAADSEGAAQYIHFLPAPDVARPDAAPAGVAAATPPDRLQTAIVRFEKDGTAIDLVGVVHLADAAYYAALNERLKGYDAVLYEMVGGPHGPDKAAPGGESADEMATIRQVQQLAKSFLGLEFQVDAIDYAAPNFVHADLAWAEFDELMKARNETIMTLFTRAMDLAEAGEVAGVPSGEVAMEAMMKRLFNAVLTGNSAELKRTVAPFLGEAESFITRLEGDDGTVIVSERNRVVLEKLAEVRTQKGKGKYAIFFGAGHMPDFEKRLLAEGFAKGETTWLDAWLIPTGAAAATTGSPVEGILRLLSENPEIMSGIKDLGTVLEDLGGALKSITPPAPAPVP